MNTTVFAGMFIPIEKVYVENKIFNNPAWKSTSTVSFRSGSKPPWWIPIPFIKIPFMAVIVAKSLST